MALYEHYRYLMMTLDPVHVGTGGYRLGRVDNSIVREPGTRVPKIPGSSIHGAARNYAARKWGDLATAGKDHDKVPNLDTNPVCYTFGYAKGGEREDGGNAGVDKGSGWAGVVNVFDARILLFPVHSMAGPVWVSTKARLEEAGFTTGMTEELVGAKARFTNDRSEPLNLGWLMVESGGKVNLDMPANWQDGSPKRLNAIEGSIAVVSENLFSHVVNSNLEVRTSVSIDPFRGAAEDGALFTYEAIPRATFLQLECVIDDYRDAFQSTNGWKSAKDVLSDGLRLMEWLGVGGMGTRGFGRIAIVGKPAVVDEPGPAVEAKSGGGL